LGGKGGGGSNAARADLPPTLKGKLVLEASTGSAAFDCKTVDCPFVFHRQGRFYMTYAGFDGTGYQEGCILGRDPASPVTRYNIAMSWIVRENAPQSPGNLKKVDGRFLGVYHAYPNPGLEEGPAAISLCWSGDPHHWTIDPPCNLKIGVWQFGDDVYQIQKPKPKSWISTESQRWRCAPTSVVLRNP